MKDLYFKTLREQWRVLFRLSLLFAGPRALFAAARPLLMISHGSDFSGSIPDLALFLRQSFLPFADEIDACPTVEEFGVREETQTSESSE